MRLTLGSSQFSEGGIGEMVLRDEKERIRLARLSRSIRKETKCCIYRSKHLKENLKLTMLMCTSD